MRHYKILKRLDFLEDSFQLQLTPESLELFNLGRSGQGFIGLVDLENGDIHLYPGFNKNVGLLIRDVNGEKFNNSIGKERYAVSRGELGKIGDLHDKVVSELHLMEKGGSRQGLLGFGLWKGGTAIKFLSSIPAGNAIIPDEILFVKEKTKWKMLYVNRTLLLDELHPVLGKKHEINTNDIPGLSDALEKINDKLPQDLSERDYEKIVMEWHKKTYPESNQKIKLIKTRSTSQNKQAIEFHPKYIDFFNKDISEGKDMHVFNQERELPKAVHEKIASVLYRDLNIFSLGDSILPMEISLHHGSENSWEKRLHDLISVGAVAKALELIETDAVDINIEKNGKTPFILAVESDLSEVALKLIEKGVSVNAKDKNGNTALVVAIQNRNQTVALTLIDAGARINVEDVGGNTLLMLALERSLYKVALKLIERGADINVEDVEGKTLLMLAAESSLSSVAVKLIEKGVSVNAKDKNGNTALRLALSMHGQDAACKLIDAGADVNAKDAEGKTLLMLAVERRLSEVALKLIDAGADINVEDVEGKTLLMLAAESSLSSVAVKLIEKGVSVNAKDKNSNTALRLALSHSRRYVAYDLINAGADVNEKDAEGETLLMLAAKKGDIQIVQSLIKKGADPIQEKISSEEEYLKKAKEIDTATQRYKKPPLFSKSSSRVQKMIQEEKKVLQKETTTEKRKP